MGKESIRLVPLSESDKAWLYKLATQSDGTEHWYGEETGEEIPNEKTFFEDFTHTYFSDEDPHGGRSFAIVHDKEYIGQINYNEIKDGVTDFDIIIGANENMSKGFGTRAVNLLIDHLRNLGIKVLQVKVAETNLRARKAYIKLGFEFCKVESENGVKWIVRQMEL